MLRPILAALAATALGGALVARFAGRRYDVRDKVILVAGGSRGLGLVVARELVRRGARPVLLARHAEELERARLDLAKRGGHDVVVARCDVTDAGQIRDAVAGILTEAGRIDALIDCVGEIVVGPYAAMTQSDFESAMVTNFWGPLQLVGAVLPTMRAHGGGRIVNVSSIGGRVAVPHLLPYVASKFAMTGFSLGLRAELAKEGVVVTTVFPGLMATGSPDHALFKGNRAAEFAWFASAASAPFLSMSPERAARGIVRALVRGRASVVLGLPAKLAVLAEALAPGVVAAALAAVDRLLPAAEGENEARPGLESRTSRSPAWLTARSDRAALRNNE